MKDYLVFLGPVQFVNLAGDIVHAGDERWLRPGAVTDDYEQPPS